MIDNGSTLARRLERYRSATHSTMPVGTGPPHAGRGAELAERLAAAMDGEVVTTAEGSVVRCEGADPRRFRSIASAWRRSPDSRHRTPHWSASTPRQPDSRPPREPWPS